MATRDDVQSIEDAVRNEARVEARKRVAEALAPVRRMVEGRDGQKSGLYRENGKEVSFYVALNVIENRIVDIVAGIHERRTLEDMAKQQRERPNRG